MEWSWLIAPAVVIVCGLGGWQWKLSAVLAKKVDNETLERKLRDVDTSVAQLSKELVDHKYNMLEKFVSKVDLDQRFEHIDQTLERQNVTLEKHDAKFDTLLREVTTLTATVKKAL